MDEKRKLWNERQQELRRMLTCSTGSQQAIELFLEQHTQLHSGQLAGAENNSFDDDLWIGLGPPDARRIPRNSQHSIAWLIWHMARIEDVTMNILVAGSPQVLRQETWSERLKVTIEDTGNALDAAEIAGLSDAIDITALREYRLAVGKRTQDIVHQLQPGDLKKRVGQDRLRQILAEGAVNEKSIGLLDYWGGLTIAGLLLMPPTRHNFIHLNEAGRTKKQLYMEGRFGDRK